MNCPECGKSKVVDFQKPTTFGYKTKHGIVKIKAVIPYHRCLKCKLEYWGLQGELARAAAVRKYLKDHGHRCHYRDCGGNNKTIMLRCRVCDNEITRDRTKSEKRRWAKKWSRDRDESDRMHHVFRDFRKRFRTFEDRGPFKIGKKTYKHNLVETGWKWSGWELMDRISKWAVKYPKDVHVCGCDDTHHASSDIVLILHRVGNRLWGTTVIVVTQCDGEPPKEFFLYPGHADGLLRAMKATMSFDPFNRTDHYARVIWKRIKHPIFGRKP